jgi:hypothetical protein
MSDKNKEFKCTVVSFVPFELVETKPGCYPPTFRIPKSDTKIPSILSVGKTFHGVYLDETRGSLKVENASDLVARAIVEDYVTSQLGVSDDARPGIFWVPGEYTAGEILQRFPEECEEAKSNNQKWFEACCRIADNDFAKYKQHNVVSSAQRKMAELLGWDPKAHEWMMPKSVLDAAKEKCFACFSPLNSPEQKVCHVCKAVLVKDDSLVFAN